jgi:Sensors of blue-light using FAD
MQLSQTIYLSRLVQTNESELRDIVTKSVANNGASGITGMLLYADGDVLQVLEGERSRVEALFQRIRQDKRHKDLFVVADEAIPYRYFSDWSMGYRKLRAEDLDTLNDYCEVFKSNSQRLAASARPGVALEVIKSFSAWAMTGA